MRAASRWTLAGAIGVLVVASVGVGRFGAPLRAEPSDAAIALSAQSAAADNTAPTVSDNGAVVAYEVTSQTAARVDVVDRVTGATTSVPTPGARLPALSGGGCVIAYVVPSEGSTALWVHDRCAEGDDTATELASFDGALAGAARAPALSADGAVIAWSTGREVVTFERVDGAYAAGPVLEGVAPRDGDTTAAAADDDAADSTGDDVDDTAAAAGDAADGDAAGADDATAAADDPAAAEPLVTGGEVAVSGDGTTVAFTAGPGDEPYAPAPANVYVADLATVAAADGDASATNGISLVSATIDGIPSSGRSSSPSLPSDGSFVVFDSTSTDVAALSDGAPDDLGSTFVVLVEPGVGTSLLAPDGAAPDLSPDGRHVVYESSDAIRTITWLEDGQERPFGRVIDELAVATIDSLDAGEPVAAGGAVTRPRISALGRYVVFDSARGPDLVLDEQHHDSTNVFAVERRPMLEGGALDLGEAAPGAELAGDVVFENTGSSGVDLAEIRTTGGIDVAASTCIGVLHPGATCTVSLTATMPESQSISATVTVSSTSWDAVTFLIDVIGGGPAQVPTTTTTTTTTTTIPSTTTPRPRPTPPPTTRATTTTTIPASALVGAAPAVIDFAPTIIGAGRRVAAVTVTNNDSGAGRSVAIGAATVSGDASFAIASDGCGGTSLSGGAACVIEVDFAPLAIGSVTGVLAVEVDNDRTLSIPLSGIGADTPVVEIVPGVAGQGQVVTVFGSGFPAGAGVELVVGEGRGTTQQLQVDDTGRLATSVLILPNSATGPMPLTVTGQPDLFASVTETVLVGNDGNRSTAATFGGLGPHMGR